MKEEIAKVIETFGWTINMHTAINRIIALIADDIERISPETAPTSYNVLYAAGAKDEHAYIVEYFRGLLDI